MERLLLLLHTELDGSLAPAALEALGLAQSVLDPATETLTVGLVGAAVAAAADLIAASQPTRIFGVQGVDFAAPRYGSDAAAAEAICRAATPTLVIAPATCRWNRVLPGVASRLHGVIDTHITGVNDADHPLTVQRWFYRQRIEATIRRSQRPWFLLAEPGIHQAWEGAAGKASVEMLSVDLPSSCRRTQVIGLREPPTTHQTIRPDAKLLFVAGAGWTKKQPDGQWHVREAEQAIVRFLELTQASLGSTKSLVDLSAEGEAVLPFLTHLNQVGQTGSTPRHLKGLATCCHGEEPHTVGWRFITERRAICLDPNCGWARGKADVLYVADAFAVMDKLNALLQTS
ncbi:MAG: electron transfer flavoprotein subunit alpha [Verrucomicrobiota bacterium]